MDKTTSHAFASGVGPHNHFFLSHVGKLADVARNWTVFLMVG